MQMSGTTSQAPIEQRYMYILSNAKEKPHPGKRNELELNEMIVVFYRSTILHRPVSQTIR